MDLVNIVLAGPARTAIGSFLGAFTEVPAPVMGAEVLKASLSRAALEPDLVDEVIFGNAVSAGLGQNVARQVGLAAGLKPSVGAMTVNRMGGSGLQAVVFAARSIQCGEAGVIAAGGTENMTRAPYLLDKARTGYKMGNGELIDAMIRDGLWDPYRKGSIEQCGERCAARYGLTREDQDRYAIESYRRAVEAVDLGLVQDEIVPIEVGHGKSALVIKEDAEPRRYCAESIRAAEPLTGQDGTVTAVNASRLGDGAAALLVMAEAKARELGITPQARIIAWASAARDPEEVSASPVAAIQKVLARAGLSVSDVDLWEISETFSAVPLVAMKELGIERCQINVLGGSIALGHPIGASGARSLVTLLNALKQRHKTIGLEAVGIEGGEALAMIVERLS